MQKPIIAALLFALFSAPALAAPALIQVKDGENKDAHDIRAETVTGILWDEAARRPGLRIALWEVNVVRYSGQAMGEYNGLTRQLSGERGDPLIRNGNSYLEGDRPEDFTEDEWEYIKLQCEYFVARGHGFTGDWEASIEGLEGYIRKAEGMIYSGTGVYSGVRFTSGVTGDDVSNAGGLNRYYLDALEALGQAYMRVDDAEAARTKGFAPLRSLCESLSRPSGASEYFEWPIRALRASALYAEDAGDFAAAGEAYSQLQAVALRQNPGNPSRVAHEAQLKVGFMMIRQGNLRDARARFFEAVRNWETAHLDPDFDDLSRGSPPRPGWMDEDAVYLTSGSYIGQGMAAAAEARTARDWAEALERFSMGLSLFNADDELRSIGLLGAANAAANLADVNSGDERLATIYAKLASKYLDELTTLLPNTRAAKDTEAVEEIREAIATHGESE